MFKYICEFYRIYVKNIAQHFYQEIAIDETYVCHVTEILNLLQIIFQCFLSNILSAANTEDL